MTDDRIIGAAREGVGRLQDAAGGLVGDEKTQARGKLNQAAGAVQGAIGKAKDQAELAGDYAQDALDDLAGLVRDRPLAAVGASLGVGLLLGLLLAGRHR